MSGHLFVTSSWSDLGFCSRTMIQNTPANPPLNGWRKTKWRLWSGLVKVLTWILLRCCGMTLKRRFMLENPPMWLNYNNSAKMSGPKFLHSAVNRLIASYRKRLMAVVAAKGGPTSYQLSSQSMKRVHLGVCHNTKDFSSILWGKSVLFLFHCDFKISQQKK